MSDNFDIFNFMFYFMEHVKNLGSAIYEFFFYKVYLTGVNEFVIKVSSFFNTEPSNLLPEYICLWELMAGTGLIVILILVIIKKIIPALG